MSDHKRYLTSSQVASRYGRTIRTISRWVEDPPSGFPLPVRVNGRNLWEIGPIEAWEQSLAAAVRQPVKEAA